MTRSTISALAAALLFALPVSAQQPGGAAPAEDGISRRPARADSREDPASRDREAEAPQAVDPPPARRVSTGSGNTLDLGTTSITGNQELPKVLYIVPWKRSDLTDLVGRPVNTLLEEVLAPIDPDVFERHVDYYGLLYADGAPASPAGAAREAEIEED